MMYKIEAIVRPEKFEAVRDALEGIQVNGLNVYEVQGYGVHRGHNAPVKGGKTDIVMKKKIKFEIVVSSEQWADLTIDTIKKAAYTGEYGDGKIFCYEIKSATKIRTGETGYGAVQEVSH